MAAVIAAATQENHVFPLAALPLFAENSHQGQRPSRTTFRLGTTLAISNTATGMPVCLYDSSTRPRCTGKERDAETGLDYFGARYFSGAQGRWTSPDPSNLGVDFWLPQTWNRYAMALNNPLKFVDRNGYWPTSIHEKNVDQSLPGLSGQMRQLLKDASYAVDHSTKYLGVFDSQSGEASPMHSMSNGNDPDEAHALGLAMDLSDRFIQENEATARTAQAEWEQAGNTGISPKALLAFGNALHTIQDGTSPAHAGFQPWSGCWLPFCANGAWHAWRERPAVYNSMQGQVIQTTRQAFQDTFGFMLLMYATDGLQPQVTSKISFDVPKQQEQQ